jgi:NitT/TauT family transport system substrate-binding protein
MLRPSPRLLVAVGALVGALATLVVAGGPAAATPRAGGGSVTLRLGYFPNVTHASAIVGVESGIFAKKLGSNVDLQLKTFNAGPEAVQAIQAGALDATYIGPNPTITAWTQLNKDVRVISGSASGRAALVVKPNINSAADLKGKSVASPQLGGTQDVSLRTWLKKQGLKTDTSGGGDVSIKPQDNATILDSFKRGDIVGAWTVEPWTTRLVTEGGGKVLVNEGDLWPQGKYVTTQLIVTTKFLQAHPDVVQKLVDGQVAANAYLKSNVADSQALVSQGIQKVTGKPIAGDLVIAAFRNIQFTNDPIASSLTKDNADAKALGLPAAASLKGLYDLSFLNKALNSANEAAVSSKT